MAVTGAMYGQFLRQALNKEHDWDTDTYRAMLTTAGYVPNQDTHDYRDDVTSEVAAGGGYTAGGWTLANKTVTYTAATNTIMLDADDVVQANSTITLPANGSVVIYNDTPATNATKGLAGYNTTDTQIASTNNEFRIAWNASGVFSIVVA